MLHSRRRHHTLETARRNLKMALCGKLCRRVRGDDDEETEPARVISHPSNGRWHGGMRPCQRTPSTDSDIRRRDFTQGIAVDQTFHIEVIRPVTPITDHILPAADANIVEEQQKPFAAFDAVDKGKKPVQGPMIPPTPYDDPNYRFLVAPWGEYCELWCKAPLT